MSGFLYGDRSWGMVKTLSNKADTMSIEMGGGPGGLGRMVIDGQPDRRAVCHDGVVSEKNRKRNE